MKTNPQNIIFNQGIQASVNQMKHPIGLWEFDLITMKLNWDSGVFEILEISPEKEKPSYEYFLSFVHKEDRKMVETAFHAAIKNRTTYNLDNRIVLKNGEVKWINLSCVTLYNTSGKPALSRGILKDISNAPRQKFFNRTLKLKAALTKLDEALLENVSEDHLFEHTSHALDEYFNSSTARIFHYEYNSNKLTPFIKKVTNRHKDKIAENVFFELSRNLPSLDTDNFYSKTITTGLPLILKNPEDLLSLVIQISGESLSESKCQDIIEQSKLKSYGILPLKNPIGIQGLLCLQSTESLSDLEIEDVCIIVTQANTLIKKFYIKEALLKKEALYRGLFDSANVGVFVIDKESYLIQEVNAKGADQLGYSINELIGQPSTILFKRELTEMALEKIDLLQQQGRIVFETKQLKKNGTLLDVEVSSNLLSFQGKEIIQSFVRDINTKREELKEKERLFNQMRHSEEQYKTLVRQSPIGILLIEPFSGTLIDANKSMLKILDLSIDMVLKLKLQDITTTSISDELETILKTIQGNNISKVESEFINSKGMTIPVELNISQAMYGDALPVVMLNVMDISERKSSERKNTILFDLATMAGSDIGVIQFCQFTHQKILSYMPAPKLSIARLESNETIEFIYVIDKDLHEKEIPIRKNGLGLTEYVIKTKKALRLNGNQVKTFQEKNSLKIYGRIAINWIGAPIIHNDQSIGMISCYSHENNLNFSEDHLNFLQLVGSQIGMFLERKKVEYNLRQSEEKFRGIFESIADIFIRTDMLGNIIMVSPSIKEVFGVEQHELIGKPTSLFYNNLSKRDELINLVQKNGIARNFETEMNHFNGSVIDVSISSKLYIDTNGNVGIESIVRDITEKKIAERKLIELNETLEQRVHERTKQLEKMQGELESSLAKERELGDLKSRFVSTASHQFRTPLTVIQSSLSILEMQVDQLDGNMKNQFHKASDRIQGQIEKMTDLMNDVLVLGKINAGNIKANLQPTDLIQISKDMVSKYEEIQLDSRCIEIKIEGEPRLLLLDQKLIDHALSNLISNAFKYSQGKRSPELSIEFLNNQTILMVQDFGIGIPKNELKNIFEPFYRASNAQKINGTGLGMTIVKEYIELNNGTIDLQSVENKSTTITVTLKP